MEQSLQKSNPFSFNLDDCFEIIRYRSIPQPLGHRPGDQVIVLKVNDDSLSGAGIQAGDWVCYKVTRQARPGQLCLVKTPAGEMVRFCHPQPDGRILLTAASDAYAPQTWLSSEIKLQGVIVMSGRDWL